MTADAECHGDWDLLFSVLKFCVIHPVTEILQLLQCILLPDIMKKKDKFLTAPAADKDRGIQSGSHMLSELL